MKKTALILTLSLFISLFFSIASSADELVIYKAPYMAEASPEFMLEVNGRPVFVYNTRVAAYAYFSFEGKADIKMTYGAANLNFYQDPINFYGSDINSCDIRPLSKQIEYKINKDQVQFSLDKPANLSVEINKNIKRPLFIFANPLETEIPDTSSSSVIYFRKGKIHTPGTVIVKSNQTVYIEGGAIVRGSFVAEKAKNVKIIGRGIIDHSMYENRGGSPIVIYDCEDVLFEGIIINEAKGWNCTSYSSRNVEYRNMKMISGNSWGDGIDIVGSKKVLVDNCFIKAMDDCIAVKAGVSYIPKYFNETYVEDVLFRNSVLWKMGANAIEIGFETRTDTMKNITFRNIDIIHCEGVGYSTFSIHNGDRAFIKNVLLEDIRVEDLKEGWLIDFRILESVYSKDKTRGYVDNVRFRNINVESDFYPFSQIIGFDETHTIKNVILQNFRIHGRQTPGTITIVHADPVRYR
jgi:hypothetical protein